MREKRGEEMSPFFLVFHLQRCLAFFDRTFASLSLSLSLKKKSTLQRPGTAPSSKTAPTTTGRNGSRRTGALFPSTRSTKVLPTAGRAGFGIQKWERRQATKALAAVSGSFFRRPFFFFFFFFQFLVFLHARAALPSPLHPSSTLHGRCRSSLLFALAGAERAQS